MADIEVLRQIVTEWKAACLPKANAAKQGQPNSRDWIGPIVAVHADDCSPVWHAADDVAPTRPQFGGYLPCRDANGWRADGSLTRLMLYRGAWYIQRPQGFTRCRRAVVIAVDAIYAGVAVPSGVTIEEAEKAKALHAAGVAAWRWAATDAGQASIGAADVWREAPASSDLGW